jgi:hypothetical protein
MGPDLFQDFQAVLLAEPQIEKDQARMRLFEVAAQVLPGRHGSRRHIVFLQIIGDRLPHHHVVSTTSMWPTSSGSPGIPPLLISIADCSPAKGSDNRTRLKQTFGCPSIMRVCR